jgi:hypothetical protein
MEVVPVSVELFQGWCFVIEASRAARCSLWPTFYRIEGFIGMIWLGFGFGIGVLDGNEER